MKFDRILQTALAFESSQALFAGHRLGLFKLLHGQPMTAEELAKRSGLAPRALLALANALVALGFLRKDGGRYHNAEDVDHLLIPGTPTYLGGFIDYEIDSVYQTWGQAIPSLREGIPVGGLNAWNYMYGSLDHCRALEPVRYALGYMFGKEIAQYSDFSKCTHLLTVADAGRYIFQIMEANPKLRVTIVDGPANMDSYLQAWVAERKLQSRVTFLSCNFVEAEFPRGCDGAFIPEIIQNWSDETLIRIFKRARGVLPPGAPCAVAEFWLNEEKTGPVGSCMHNLQMVLRSEEGYHRNDPEMISLLERSGFEKVTASPPFGNPGIPMVVVRGTVPA